MDPIDIIKTIRTSKDTIIVIFHNKDIAISAYNELKNKFSYKQASVVSKNNTIEMKNFHSCLFLLNILNFLKKNYDVTLSLN